MIVTTIESVKSRNETVARCAVGGHTDLKVRMIQNTSIQKNIAVNAFDNKIIQSSEGSHS